MSADYIRLVPRARSFKVGLVLILAGYPGINTNILTTGRVPSIEHCRTRGVEV